MGRAGWSGRRRSPGRAALLLWLLWGGCDCTSRSHGPLEAGAPEAGLPEVEATRCEELGPGPEGTVCVEAGWFALPLWSTMRWDVGPTRCEMPRARPVFLPAFHIDVTEVSNEQWLEAVEAGVVEPPPARCGVTVRPGPLGDPEYETRSGWREDGTVPGARRRQPVVCIPPRQAQAYCAWRGGRLPTVLEWMKAGRAPWPDQRRFPWGDEPPPLDLGAGDEGWMEQQNRITREYAHLTGYPDRFGIDQIPLLADVGTRPLGASAYGVQDMAGNVAEWLQTCPEELAGLARDEPLVVRALPGRAALTCPGRDRLAAGSHWGTPVTPGLALGVSTVSPAGVMRAYDYTPASPDECQWFAEDLGAWVSVEEPLRTIHWGVGLRCVYPGAE